MKNLSKKSISLVLIFTITMAIFMPSMVNATTTVRQLNKIVITTTSETLTFDGREHNSTVYAGEIKKDGVTVLSYLYSDDITRSSVVFDNLRKALSNPYSDMIPSVTGEQTEAGLKELSASTLNGIDLTTISNGWTNASNIATQIYNGTTIDIVNNNMYDVDNGFKAEIDNSTIERAAIDNPLENNKRIISHLGTKTTDEVSFTVVEGQLMENHNVNLIYLSEATTVIYTSVNVTTSSTPTLSNIELNATFTGTEGEIVINNERTPEGRGYNGTLNNAGYTDSNNNNKIVVNTSFGMQPAKKITINGTNYDCNGTDSNEYQVPGASSYTITVEADTGVVTPKTIIWANPGATDIDAEDALIKNGSAKIVAVYNEDGNKLNYKDYTNQQEQPDGSKSDEYGLNNGNGWAVVKPGYKVEFEFTPEYGYQLTKVMANEQTLAPQETTNHYTFTMPDTNVHFAATFTKTEDIVKADSDKVSSGSIQLGNKLDGGTVQLSVSNVELSADKIKGFEGAAEGYTVANYLDIDLYNVFYKGKADSDDVWSNKIDELDKEATISLKLADGLTADDIVIVHNIHDGEEYEVIKIDSYDPDTNTITFKTKSFSNYAIATKTSSTEAKTETTTTDNSKNPKTGDNIAITISIFAISTLGAYTTLKVNRSRKMRKH